jgi:uncharacterized protein
MKRREFLAAAAAAVALPPTVRAAGLATRDRPTTKAMPFALGRIRLNAGPCLEAAERNRAYVISLEPDRLLHSFRVTAGLPSSAEPIGGWERPDNELRGHFTGHYLSACALMSQSPGDDSMKARGEKLIEELAKCQAAHGNGFLSAFPEELFDRLRRDVRVWAPFYTVHKIMAGLLDMHLLCGSAQALDVLKGMVEWTRRWADPLGEAHMARVLEREYGGMNDLLYRFAALSGSEDDFELAHRFDHERIFAPLAEGRDELKGLHVNTQIPKIIGAAQRYEMTGEARYRDIARYFWTEVTERRSYCTGGTSNGERWGSDPGQLAGELSGYTQECCCTYNMLKLTRQLFGWSADERLADYYERAFFNGVLGTQHPKDGMTVYYVPLASGYWKLFGRPLDAFWCCTGTGIESFSKLGDSVYFHDDDGVYVNLYVASEADWREKGVRIVQKTRFPEEEQTALTMRSAQPVRMALRVRVPAWTGKGAGARLNGRPLEGFAAPGSYFVVDRTWKDGDRLELKLPMSLRAEALPGAPAVQAFLYGPVVLAGRLGTEGLTPELLRAEPTKPREIPEYKAQPVAAPALRASGPHPADWIRSIPGRPLAFRTSAEDRDIDLIPLYRVIDERYAVYWNLPPRT